MSLSKKIFALNGRPMFLTLFMSLVFSWHGQAETKNINAIMDLGIDYNSKNAKKVFDIVKLTMKTFTFPDGTKKNWYELNQDCLNQNNNDNNSTSTATIAYQNTVTNTKFHQAIEDAATIKTTKEDNPWWSALDNYQETTTPKNNTSWKKITLTHFPYGCVLKKYLSNYENTNNLSRENIDEILQTFHAQISNAITEEKEGHAVEFWLGSAFGGSYATPQVRLENTPLYSLYSFVAIFHGGASVYTWEQFLDDYEIRNSFFQPRFGLFAQAYFKNIISAEAEVMSSPSNFNKMAYSATISVGRKINLSNEHWYVPIFAGYSFTKDNGFGATTLVELIGHKEARELASTFFNPEDALGSSWGELAVVQTGIGYKYKHFNVVFNFEAARDLKDNIAPGAGKNHFLATTVRIIYQLNQ